MTLSKLYTDKGYVISSFRGNSYTTAFKQAIHELQWVFKSTIFLPVNAKLNERLYCVENNIKFRPKCRCCKQNDVSYDHPNRSYKRYCSDICASKDRSSFYSVSEETREKLSKASVISNAKLNDQRLIEWKQTIVDKFPDLDFTQFEWKPFVDCESVITCKTHGSSTVSIRRLLNSDYGCKQCGFKAKNKSVSNCRISKSKKSFDSMMISERSHQITDNTLYVDDNTLVEISCNVHGIVNVRPGFLKSSKYQCPSCGRYQGGAATKWNIDKVKSFVYEKFEGNIQVLSNTYTGVFDKMSAFCNIHNEQFETSLAQLQQSEYGCVKCGRDSHSYQHSNDIEYVNDVLEEKADGVICLEYTRFQQNSKFFCEKHGGFEDTWEHVMYRDYSCPKCLDQFGRKTSKEELAVRTFIESLNCETMNNSRPFGFEIDILSDKFAVEYNGIYWHSENKVPDRRGKYHKNKTDICRQNGIFLLHIWEDQWMHSAKQEIIKSMIRSKLNVVTNKIHARKCEIVDLSNHSSIVQEFLDANHIQGRTGTQIAYGLKYQETIVSVMTFSYYNNELHLNRFANILNTNVNGAFTKLLLHFQRNNNINEIYTFADLSYSYGDVYIQHGFETEYEIEPGYFYVYRDKRYHRSSFTKKNIKERFNVDIEGKTETQLIHELGILRIWDCGKIKFKKTF